MKSNYQSTPIEHLENRGPKCKMHTQERQLTHFLYITTDLQRKPNRRFFKTKLNLRFFSKPNRTELEKSLVHSRKHWTGHVLQHHQLLCDLMEGRMVGKPTRGRRRLQMLQELYENNGCEV